ncbi:hypothetical protein CWI76_11100 [Pseudidiomarina marina]|uniref:Uncharacterized protein n=1 Tax=Pseudidiomarina marina TaxID=502366 RepID=A0A432YCK1_9GAMM|nr:hypothetical protein CWI76_11100 [Pseudidiomarina marina]
MEVVIKNTGFSKTLTIDGIDYNLSFNGSSFHLGFINRAYGNRYLSKSGLVWFGEDPEHIYHEINQSINVFKLSKLVLKNIVTEMAKLQPEEFVIEANSPRKTKIYRRFCNQIYKYLNHLYDLEFTNRGAVFKFNKKPKSIRCNLPLAALTH